MDSIKPQKPALDVQNAGLVKDLRIPLILGSKQDYARIVCGDRHGMI